MGNGITILQHNSEPTKWQERQGKKLVRQGLVSLFHIQPKGVAEMQVYAAQLEQKHICHVQILQKQSLAIPIHPPMHSWVLLLRMCPKHWGCFYSKNRSCALQHYIPFLNHDFIIEISVISNIFAESGLMTRYTIKRQQRWVSLSSLGVDGSSDWKEQMLCFNCIN